MATIVIIAVLAAMIGAVLNVAHARADAAKCMGNLRQLVAANLTYAAENGGQFCPAQDPTNTIRWHGVRDQPRGKFDPTRGPLSPYLGANRQVKLCPALDRVLKGFHTFEEGTGGYGYNATYIGGNPVDPFTPARMASLQSPAAVVMFTDTAFPRPTGLQEYPYAEPWRWEDYKGRLRGELDPSVHFRHSGHANVAWCDGHVSAEPHSHLGGRNTYGGDSTYWKVGWFGRSENNGYWRPQQ